MCNMAAWVCLFHLFYRVTLCTNCKWEWSDYSANDLRSHQVHHSKTANSRRSDEGAFFDSHSTINDLVCIKNIACGRCSVIQHTMTRLDLLRLEHFSRMCTWQVGGNIYFICMYLLKYHSRGCRLVKRGSVGPNKDCLFLYYPPKKADWRDPHILSITHWASCSHRKWVVHLVYK